MIFLNQLSKIGRAFKPHGINGEISISLDYDCIPTLFSCLIFEIEGIFVPFFIEQFREKSQNSFLVKFKGMYSDVDVAELSNHDIYAQKFELDVDDDCDEMYAEDFIGYKIYEQNKDLIGEIIDYDDSTENALFIVRTVEEEIVYIPIVEDFIVDINNIDKNVTMALPSGLLDL